jgi:hypothetical protein
MVVKSENLLEVRSYFKKSSSNKQTLFLKFEFSFNKWFLICSKKIFQVRSRTLEGLEPRANVEHLSKPPPPRSLQ